MRRWKLVMTNCTQGPSAMFNVSPRLPELQRLVESNLSILFVARASPDARKVRHEKCFNITLRAEHTAAHGPPGSLSHNNGLTQIVLHRCVMIHLEKRSQEWDMFLQYQFENRRRQRGYNIWVANVSKGLSEHPPAEIYESTIASCQDTVKATGIVAAVSSLLYAWSDIPQPPSLWSFISKPCISCSSRQRRV